MLLDRLGLRDQLGLLEPQALRGRLDQPELRVLLDRLEQVQQDLPGLLELQVLLDRLDQPELQDQLVQVQQDLRGLVELRVLLDLRDQPELQGLPDRLLHQF